MNLYRLERMKIRLSAYLWAIFGIFAGLLALGILFLFLSQTEAGTGGGSEEAQLFASWNGLLALMTALAFACCSVLSAAVSAKVIVSEYCGRCAVILLSYPIRRNVLLGAKSLFVCGITLISAFLSNTGVIGAMYAAANIFKITPQMSTGHFPLTVLAASIFMGISAAAVGIVSATFGLKKHSATAAVICALLLVCVFTNFITVSPGNILPVMCAVTAGLLFPACVIYRTLEKALEKMEV